MKVVQQLGAGHAWLEEQYGKLTAHERKMVNAIRWYGDTTLINLKYDAVTKQGTLYFLSQALSHRLNEVHKRLRAIDGR